MLCFILSILVTKCFQFISACDLRLIKMFPTLTIQRVWGIYVRELLPSDALKHAHLILNSHMWTLFGIEQLISSAVNFQQFHFSIIFEVMISPCQHLIRVNTILYAFLFAFQHFSNKRISNIAKVPFVNLKISLSFYKQKA